jgi:uncharacterized DUF497 family protein
VIYEWDPKKATENQRKHGLSFDDAAMVFLDPLAITFDDPEHSLNERRFITIGMTTDQRLVFVAHVDVDEDRIRIISARETTRRESYDYQERIRKHQ